MKYAKVNSLEELFKIQFREIEPRNCPHFIMVGEHYREDGTCLCNDRDAVIMAEWGYVWSEGLAEWIAPEDEPDGFADEGDE